MVTLWRQDWRSTLSVVPEGRVLPCTTDPAAFAITAFWLGGGWADQSFVVRFHLPHYCALGIVCMGQAVVESEGDSCDMCHTEDERIWNAIR